MNTFKKITIALFIVTLACGSAFGAARPNSKKGLYFVQSLSGGATGALDTLDITGASTPNEYDLIDGDGALVLTISGTTVLTYHYVFDADGTTAESSPLVIRPDDYATAGVWRLTLLQSNLDSDGDGDFTDESWYSTLNNKGSAITLDIGDDGGDDSVDLNEIAIIGDTNSIFQESSADKLRINLGSDWPKADVADSVTVADNEATAENNPIWFSPGAAGSGNLTPEADGDFHYNPSTGLVTATGFAGALTGNASGSAATLTGDLDPDQLSGDTTDDNLIDQDIIEGFGASTTPKITLDDSDGADGFWDVNATDADDAVAQLGVDDSGGDDQAYIELDGVNETVDILQNATMSGTLNVTGQITGDLTGTASGNLVSGGAIGAATATTPAEEDNDTSVATTAYVQTELADQAPALGADDNYVTDAEKVVIGNTSGTNSGDNTVATAAASQVITDNALATVDDADAADNDFAKFTANGLEGRSYAEVLSDIGAAPALGADDNYVTDAQAVVIGNTSGTNTGDDDIPESGDFGAAADLDSDGGLSTGAVDVEEVENDLKTHVIEWVLDVSATSATKEEKAILIPTAVTWQSAYSRCDGIPGTDPVYSVYYSSDGTAFGAALDTVTHSTANILHTESITDWTSDPAALSWLAVDVTTAATTATKCTFAITFYGN